MMAPLTFGSLFAGIGGLDLGLERAGMRCVWQVEISPYCRAVLAKHWPDVTRYEDVRNVGGRNLAPVDVICGGFPCQDISGAGHRVGIGGERSGLWGEFARIVGELRPCYVLVENVAALPGRGMDRVLGDLSSLGYDAEWSIVSACALGAPHPRERVFIVAHPAGRRWGQGIGSRAEGERVRHRVSSSAHPWADRANDNPPGASLVRMAHGIPSRVDRLRALGNAVVPQVAEVIGRLIVRQHEALESVA